MGTWGDIGRDALLGEDGLQQFHASTCESMCTINIPADATMCSISESTMRSAKMSNSEQFLPTAKLGRVDLAVSLQNISKLAMIDEIRWVK